MTGQGQTWHKFLSLVTFAYNIFHTPNLENYSSYKLVIGRRPKILINIEMDLDIKVSGTYKDYHTLMTKRLDYLQNMLQNFKMKHLALLNRTLESCWNILIIKCTMDAVFSLRVIMEKYREEQKGLHVVFIDLEKAYDQVPQQEVWRCMREKAVPEKYVKIIQDMYDRVQTHVQCSVGETEKFPVKVGLHQGSALSPLPF